MGVKWRGSGEGSPYQPPSFSSPVEAAEWMAAVMAGTGEYASGDDLPALSDMGKTNDDSLPDMALEPLQVDGMISPFAALAVQPPSQEDSNSGAARTGDSGTFSNCVVLL